MNTWSKYSVSSALRADANAYHRSAAESNRRTTFSRPKASWERIALFSFVKKNSDR